MARPWGRPRRDHRLLGYLTDDIDLMGIDGNQALRWVGTAALTGPGEVSNFTSGGNTIVRFSNDADVSSESEIQLTGIKTLSALISTCSATAHRHRMYGYLRSAGILVDVHPAAPGWGCVRGSHNLPARTRMDNLHSNDS